MNKKQLAALGGQCQQIMERNATCDLGTRLAVARAFARAHSQMDSEASNKPKTPTRAYIMINKDRGEYSVFASAETAIKCVEREVNADEVDLEDVIIYEAVIRPIEVIPPEAITLKFKEEQ